MFSVNLRELCISVLKNEISAAKKNFNTEIQSSRVPQRLGAELAEMVIKMFP
jgi:hypothetical protein